MLPCTTAQPLHEEVLWVAALSQYQIHFWCDSLWILLQSVFSAMLCFGFYKSDTMSRLYSPEDYQGHRILGDVNCDHFWVFFCCILQDIACPNSSSGRWCTERSGSRTLDLPSAAWAAARGLGTDLKCFWNRYFQDSAELVGKTLSAVQRI